MSVCHRLVAVLLGVVLAPSAHADAMFDYVDAASGAPQARLFVARDQVRVDIAYAPGRRYVVIDTRAGTLTLIDPQARRLTTATPEQLRELLAGIGGADPATQPLLQLALDGLDDEARAQALAQLRGLRQEAALAYTKTAVQERIAGLPCTVYVQEPAAGQRRSLCAARYPDLGLAAHDTQTLRQAVALLRTTGGPWLPAGNVEGFPLRYAGSFGGGSDGGGVLKATSREAQPPSRFADPPGYRIVSLFEMLSAIAAAP